MPTRHSCRGDALHAILCAAGYNIRWLLRAIVSLELKGLFAPLFALLATMHAARATARVGEKNRLQPAGAVGQVNFFTEPTTYSGERMKVNLYS